MWDVGCGMWDVGCGMWDVGWASPEIRGADFTEPVNLGQKPETGRGGRAILQGFPDFLLANRD